MHFDDPKIKADVECLAYDYVMTCSPDLKTNKEQAILRLAGAIEARIANHLSGKGSLHSLQWFQGYMDH